MNEASKKLRVLVTGATGRQGGAIAHALVNRGHSVRALTRQPESHRARMLHQYGVEIVEGNFDHAHPLEQAMAGLDAVFAMGTHHDRSAREEKRQCFALIDAAIRTGVQHFIYSSIASANTNTGIPHFDSKFAVESRLRSAGLPHTVVAPVFFMENLRGPWVLPGLKRGRLALPLSRNTPLKVVALSDLADVVVHVLENPNDFQGARVEVASDEITGWRAAEILGALVGRRVDYAESPIAELEIVDPDFAAMFRWLSRVGYAVDIPSLHERYSSIGWRSFGSWASVQNWKAAFRAMGTRSESLHLA